SGRVRCRGHGDALVSGDGYTSELAHNPSIRELIVEKDRVAVPIGLTHTAEPAPQRRDADRTVHRPTRRFVEYLEAFVRDLYELSGADVAVGVGRRAVAIDAREWNAIEIQ